MKTALRHVIAPLVVAAACALATPEAAAQPLTLPTQRPTQGLFGRAPKGEGLDVVVSTFEGFDDNDAGDGTGTTPLDPRTQQSGQVDGLDLAVGFKHKARHFSFDAVERSGVRYYRTLSDLVGIRHNLVGSFAGVFDHTQFGFSQTVAYAPFYSYSTLPQLFDLGAGDVAAFVPEQVLTRRPAVTLGSSGSLTETLGRATFSFAASTQRTDFLEESGTGFQSQTAFGRMLYHLTRDVGVVAGYGYQQGRYAIDSKTIETVGFNNIEIGLDYNHALSLTRRTTVGFATGTTAVGARDGSSGYRLVGDVRISRELGRTWLATGSYHRGVGLIAGLNQPVFSDAVALNVTGAVTPRVTFSAVGGLSAGEMTRELNRTDTYTGSARLQFALTRVMALSGEYTYYRYRFDNTLGLPTGIQQQFDRQSARVGLSLWLPLFR